ncbi:hypothetical protein [Glycomyces tenuis]|uniref:hypothetical protein n=1 Tax=Glycomyces tenuis TaxID=58116 RepID=UPI00054F2BDD|nr:hypothetical protein [Glycomyces tenuis]
MNVWLAVRLKLLAETVRGRAIAVWQTRDRGSIATEFAIVATAVIGVALLVVYLYKTFAEEQANKIGTQ